MHVSQTAAEIHARSMEFHKRIALVGAYRKMKGVDQEPFWPGMWMWDLVALPPRELHRKLHLRQIIKQACKTYDLSEPEFLSPSRHRIAVHVRHIVCFVARKCTRHSFMYIGQKLNRDHTSVIYAYRKVMARMKTDKDFADEVNRFIGGLT